MKKNPGEEPDSKGTHPLQGDANSGILNHYSYYKVTFTDKLLLTAKEWVERILCF